MTSGAFGPWRYIAKVRVTVHRQRIEDGYSLDDWDDRREAEIQTEKVFTGFRQITGSTLADSLPVVDTSELPAAGNSEDRRGDLLDDREGSS